MGIPTEPPMMRLRNREGIALAAAIFGIVIVSLITVGTFMLTDLDTKATYNREDSAKALRLVHTAQAHALSLFRNHLADTTITRLLRGWDNSTGTADDGTFTGFTGLTGGLEITPSGVTTSDGTYWATMMDDPRDADGNPLADSNWRFLIRCSAETPRGSRATIDFVVKYLPPLPAVTMNGNTVIQGQPTATGACGDIHTNGNVSVSGTITVNDHLTTSGTPTGSGTVLNSGGTVVGVESVPEPIPIPTMTSAEYCPSAEYVLRSDGNIYRRSDNTYHWAVGLVVFGWTHGVSGGIVTWTSNSTLLSASYCVEGNATISGNPGTSLTPVPVSIYASGSIDVSGNPNLSAYENDIVFLADGDLYIRGNSGTHYHGIMYGGSNCRVSGQPNVSGQFLCQSGPLPAGANDIVVSNLIEGNPIFTYGCTWANFNDKYKIVSWYQRVDM